MTQRRLQAMPAELESSRSKLVYLYLRVHGGATIDELSENLGVQLLTLYGVLRRLRREGLVRKADDRWLPNRSSSTDRSAEAV